MPPLHPPSKTEKTSPWPRRSAAKDVSAVVKVRAELSRLGWSMNTLAGFTRMSVAELRNVVSGNNTSARGRHRCERALEVPVWLSPEEYAVRSATIRFFGEADPYLMTRFELTEFARPLLHRAGYPKRIRPMSACLRALEEIAFARGGARKP